MEQNIVSNQNDDLLSSNIPIPKLERQHRLPVGNRPEEIIYVNENPGSEIVLDAYGGGYIVSWRYGQTSDGRFYKRALVGFEQEETLYELTDSLDPKTVCSTKCLNSQ
jgi:hypothetical protein